MCATFFSQATKYCLSKNSRQEKSAGLQDLSLQNYHMVFWLQRPHNDTCDKADIITRNRTLRASNLLHLQEHLKIFSLISTLNLKKPLHIFWEILFSILIWSNPILLIVVWISKQINPIMHLLSEYYRFTIGYAFIIWIIDVIQRNE